MMFKRAAMKSDEAAGERWRDTEASTEAASMTVMSEVDEDTARWLKWCADTDFFSLVLAV
jgi:hypothetical protein